MVLTAASGLYQEWQTRVAYHQYRKLKAESPCSDLGGFTRLLNTPNQQPDGLMDEVPTVVVKQLKPGRCDECDHGFVVMNRPWGVLQLVRGAWKAIPEVRNSDAILAQFWRNSGAILRNLTAQSIFPGLRDDAETDRMFMRPPKNVATERSPSASASTT